MKSKWKLFCTSNRPKIIILRSQVHCTVSEDTLKGEKRIMFQRRLLDWLLPIWTLPSVCEIRDKMKAVFQGMNT